MRTLMQSRYWQPPLQLQKQEKDWEVQNCNEHISRNNIGRRSKPKIFLIKKHYNNTCKSIQHYIYVFKKYPYLYILSSMSPTHVVTAR